MASETSGGKTDIRRYSAGVFGGVKCFSLLPVFFLASYVHPSRFTCSVILLFKTCFSTGIYIALKEIEKVVTEHL